MTMHTTIIRSLLATAALLAVTGCSGPSKTGLEARENAYNRIDKVNTQIAYGQAKQAFEVGKLRAQAPDLRVVGQQRGGQLGDARLQLDLVVERQVERRAREPRGVVAVGFGREHLIAGVAAAGAPVRRRSQAAIGA